MTKEPRLWMVRCAGGRWYDAFIDEGFVAVNGDVYALDVESRDELIAEYLRRNPHENEGSVRSWMSQRWRFIKEIQIDDWVVTYSAANRTYAIGQVTGAAEYVLPEEDDESEMALRRDVRWTDKTILRDDLKTATKNTLGSVLTIFEIQGAQRADILHILENDELFTLDATPDTLGDTEDLEELIDPWEDVESQALERIKDLVAKLDWSQMEALIAGILRSMGYKTQISPAGPDRGKDIVASPDGFGFENPRIVVEVKHRKQTIGASDLRSFLGGRHQGDRGLYVSTGGFTSEARYEAERATIPSVLWTLDDVVRTLMDNYDATDEETKRLVPLKRLYWPA